MVTAVYPELSAEEMCSDLIYMQLHLLLLGAWDCLSASPPGNPSCPVGKGRGTHAQAVGLKDDNSKSRTGKGFHVQGQTQASTWLHGARVPARQHDELPGPQSTHFQGSDRQGHMPQPKSMSVNSTNFPTKFLKSTQ